MCYCREQEVHEIYGDGVDEVVFILDGVAITDGQVLLLNGIRFSEVEMKHYFVSYESYNSDGVLCAKGMAECELDRYVSKYEDIGVMQQQIVNTTQEDTANRVVIVFYTLMRDGD